MQIFLRDLILHAGTDIALIISARLADQPSVLGALHDCENLFGAFRLAHAANQRGMQPAASRQDIRLDDVVFKIMHKNDSGAEEKIHRRDVDFVFLRVDGVVV